MPEHIYLLTLFLPLGTILIVFAMKYISAAYAARARLKEDAAYRALAEQALAAQQESLAMQASLRTELASLRASFASIEQILKQVE
jgi:hypothetical protein